MKITVVGATGRIGELVVHRANAAGHDVTAVVRRPDAISGVARVVTADLAHPSAAALAAAVAGADAVLSCLGARTRKDAGIVAPGTRALIAAMNEMGVRRIVTISASPVSTVPSPGRRNPPPDPGLTGSLRIITPVIKRVFASVYADLARMEDELRFSDLDWTAIRPPRLTDKPGTGAFRTAHEHNLPGGSAVSRADVADLMLRVVEQPETFGHAIHIAA